MESEPGRLLLHSYVDDRLAWAGAVTHIHCHVGEITQPPNPVLGLSDFLGVEGISFHHVKLSADHPVQGPVVTRDVDTLDEDALCRGESERDLQEPVGFVLDDDGLDVHEGIALLTCLVDHALDDTLDFRAIVDLACH